MKNKRNIIIAVIVLALCGIGGYYFMNQNNPEVAIKNVVNEFGTKIQLVSLDAPRNEIIVSIKKNYGPFISQGLLEGWEMNPERAPGKSSANSLSSEMKILTVDRDEDGAYEVQTHVTESIGSEGGTSTTSSEYQLSLKLRNQDGKWLITGATKTIPQ